MSPEGKPLKVTLCLILKDHQVLLAKKKRDFGVGKWNGYGGKKDPRETIRQAAIRELYEESCVTAHALSKVGFINFRFPESHEQPRQMTIYRVLEWDGEPVESDEMEPQWFDINKLPVEQMWDGDKLWLPDIIQGQRVRGNVDYDKNHRVMQYSLEKY